MDQGVSSGFCASLPVVIVESWMLLTLSWIELMLPFRDCKGNPWPPCMRCCARAVLWVGVIPSRICAYRNPPLCVLIMWLVGSRFHMGWSPPLVLLVLGPLEWDSDIGPYQMLCVTGLGLFVCDYHTVYCLCLCLLDQHVPVSGQSV